MCFQYGFFLKIQCLACVWTCLHLCYKCITLGFFSIGLFPMRANISGSMKLAGLKFCKVDVGFFRGKLTSLKRFVLLDRDFDLEVFSKHVCCFNSCRGVMWYSFFFTCRGLQGLACFIQTFKCGKFHWEISLDKTLRPSSVLEVFLFGWYPANAQYQGFYLLSWNAYNSFFNTDFEAAKVQS